MNYLLILDDDRSIEKVKSLTPSDVFDDHPDRPIVLAKDFKEAQQYMVNSEHLCSHICFDHFLYSSKNHMDLTGLDFARWLSMYDERRTPLLTDDFSFSVHTTDEKANKQIFEQMKDHQDLKGI